MFETKREIFLFSIIDYLSLEEHFEEMAQNGWILEKIGGITAKYKRIQPMDLVFSVDPCPELKVFKDTDKKDVEKYIKKSEDLGWKHVGSYNNLQISYSEREDNLTPVQSNEEEKLEIIQKSLSVNLINLSFTMLLFYINLLNIGTPFYYENLYSNIGIVFPVMLGVFLFASIVYLLSDGLWLIRSKISRRRDGPIPRTNYTMAKLKGSITFSLFIFVGIGLILALIGDIIVHSIPIYLVILPIGLFVIVLIIYNKWLKPKQIGGFQEFLLLLVTLLPLILISVSEIEGYSQDNYSERLEPGYIGVTAEEVGIDKEVNEIIFTKEGSVLVPKKSIYTEYYWSESIRTIHIEARNPKIAKYIFDEYIKDEVRFFENDVIKDDGYDYFDEVYYISSGPLEDDIVNKITVLKDNTIIYLHGDVDLSDEGIIDMIKDKIEED